MINLSSIAYSSSRLDALILGAEDLSSDIGATCTAEGWEVFYARSAVVIHAKAAGLQAIDTPFTDLNDLDELTSKPAAHSAWVTQENWRFTHVKLNP